MSVTECFILPEINSRGPLKESKASCIYFCEDNPCGGDAVYFEQRCGSLLQAEIMEYTPRGGDGV